MREDVFFELHEGLEKQAPGDDVHTRRAFEMISLTTSSPRILDIGCGPGRQTLELGRLTDAPIVAADLYKSFLLQVDQCSRAAGLSNHIFPVQADMQALPIVPASFDVIWSEGAIYLMGFEAGLRAWWPILRPGGCMVLTELTWLKEDPPEDLVSFWRDEYPAMTTVEENLTFIRHAGYQELGHFTLPKETWWEGYYSPLEKRLEAFRERYADEPDALETLEMEQREIDLYRLYSDWIGYVFYIARRG